MPPTLFTYLEVFDLLGNRHGSREQLVEAADERAAYGVEDEFVAEGVQPGPEVFQLLLQQQLAGKEADAKLWSVTTNMLIRR